MVSFWQIGCTRARLMYSGNVLVFGQRWFYLGKCLNLGESGCIRAKWLYSGKVVLFGQSVCIRAKVNLFGQSGCIEAKVVVFGLKWF